jgi:uncharacterized UPF0160 family protein
MKNSIKKNFPYIFLAAIVLAFFLIFFFGKMIHKTTAFFTEQYLFLTSITFFLAIAFFLIFSKVIYSFLNRAKAKLVTHPHNFHVDDIFAAATLALLMEKKGIAYEIIRTRDREELEMYKEQAREKNDKAPVFMFDVGGEYDEENNLFDHHQKEGAGVRENGISYSSLGLVWKKYGEKLCESKQISEKIDHQIVIGIDANDTGVNITEPLYNFSLYGFPSLKNSFFPISGDKKDFDIAFEKVVSIAKDVLSNEIEWAKKKLGDLNRFEKFYNQSADKRVVWIDEEISIGKYFPQHPEILFLVKKKADDAWVILGTLKNNKTKAVKKMMPAEWGGLEGPVLEETSGIKGIKFCHAGRWIAAANSREVAEKMIEEILKR